MHLGRGVEHLSVTKLEQTAPDAQAIRDRVAGTFADILRGDITDAYPRRTIAPDDLSVYWAGSEPVATWIVAPQSVEFEQPMPPDPSQRPWYERADGDVHKPTELALVYRDGDATTAGTVGIVWDAFSNIPPRGVNYGGITSVASHRVHKIDRESNRSYTGLGMLPVTQEGTPIPNLNNMPVGVSSLIFLAGCDGLVEPQGNVFTSQSHYGAIAITNG
jgi:hypothetical protein